MTGFRFTLSGCFSSFRFLIRKIMRITNRVFALVHHKEAPRHRVDLTNDVTLFAKQKINTAKLHIHYIHYCFCYPYCFLVRFPPCTASTQCGPGKPLSKSGSINLTVKRLYIVAKINCFRVKELGCCQNWTSDAKGWCRINPSRHPYWVLSHWKSSHYEKADDQHRLAGFHGWE